MGHSKKILKETIKIIEAWTSENLLTINKKKSGIIFHVNNSKKLKKMRKYMDYPILEQYKYLGVYIDRSMSYKAHLTYIQGKIENGFKLINIMKWKKLGTW